jgi:HSP20 family protein
MSITPWRRNQPQQQQLSPLGDVQRLFDRFFSNVPFGGMPAGYEAYSAFPALNVSDEGDAVMVKAEVPGLDADDLEITVEGDMLTIRGEKKAEREEKQENYYYAERSFGSFVRRVELPSAVDSNKADAKLDRGVLSLRLPKIEAAMSRTIKVGRGELGGKSGNIDVQDSEQGSQQMGSQGGSKAGSQMGSQGDVGKGERTQKR